MIDTASDNEHAPETGLRLADARPGFTVDISNSLATEAHERQRRTRNILAVLRSVFIRTMETATSLDDATAHYAGRFDTIAPFLNAGDTDHHRVYDLEMLVWDQLLRFPVIRDEDVAVTGPSQRLSHEIAQPLALALHELVANAVKFGALSTPRASKLAVEWRLDGTNLVLRWQETGVQIAREAPIPFGFGREFIEQGLPFQIGAETSFAIEPGGVGVTIRVAVINGARSPAIATGVQP